MHQLDQDILWRQMGAAIDMFGAAVRACPEALWTASMWAADDLGPTGAAPWYVTYHTLFWLDLYLSGTVEGFAPPAPFNLDELDPAGLLPPRVYTQEELLAYLAYCREKCRTLLAALTDESAYRTCRLPMGELPYVELQLDNLRHVQEHGAQLRMFLGQQAAQPARWIGRLKA